SGTVNGEGLAEKPPVSPLGAPKRRPAATARCDCPTHAPPIGDPGATRGRKRYSLFFSFFLFFFCQLWDKSNDTITSFECSLLCAAPLLSPKAQH
ncbi:mCG145548, partial [Mus musculus]